MSRSETRIVATCPVCHQHLLATREEKGKDWTIGCPDCGVWGIYREPEWALEAFRAAIATQPGTAFK